MSSPSRPHPVQRLIRRLRRLQTWRGGVLLLESLFLTLGLVGLLFWLNAMLVLHRAPGQAVALASLAASMLLVGALVWCWLTPLRQKEGVLRTARDLERRRPDIHGRISAAVELAGAEPGWLSRFSPQLLAMAYRDATRAGQSLSRWVLAPRRRLVLVVVCSLLPATSPWWLTHGSAHAVGDLWRFYIAALGGGGGDYLLVQPGNVLVPQGQDVEIRASLPRRPARAADLHFHTEGGAPTQEPMTPMGDGVFVVTLRGLQRSLTYSVQAGHARSQAFAITVGKVPALEQVRVRYRYPEHAQRDDENGPDNDGNVRVLEGSTARVTARYDAPLSQARMYLDLGEGPTQTLPMAPRGTAWQAEFVVDRSGTYTLVGLEREHGLESARATFAVEAVPDATPVITLHDLAPWQPRPTNDQLRFGYQVEDDVGVRNVELVAVWHDDSPAERVPLAQHGPGVRSVSRAHTWTLPQGGPEPLKMWVEADDHRGPRPPERGMGEPVLIGGPRPQDAGESPPPPEHAEADEQGEQGDDGAGRGESDNPGDRMAEHLDNTARMLAQAAESADAVRQHLSEQAENDERERGAAHMRARRPDPETGERVERIRRQVKAAERELDRAEQSAAPQDPGEAQDHAAGDEPDLEDQEEDGESDDRDLGELVPAQQSQEEGERPGEERPEGEQQEQRAGAETGNAWLEPGDEDQPPPQDGEGRPDGARYVRPGPGTLDARARQAFEALQAQVQSSFPLPPRGRPDGEGDQPLDHALGDVAALNQRGDKRGAAHQAGEAAGRLQGLAQRAAALAGALRGGETSETGGGGGGQDHWEETLLDTLAEGAEYYDTSKSLFDDSSRQVDLRDLLQDQFGPGQSLDTYYRLTNSQFDALVDSANIPPGYREAVAEYQRRINE